MRYLQCVNKNMAIFHGLLNPKKQASFSQDGKKRGHPCEKGKLSCQTHAYESFNFLCIETDFSFYWQRVVVVLVVVILIDPSRKGCDTRDPG